jgi:hypothetical protein
MLAGAGAANASVTQRQYLFETTSEGWWFAGNAGYDLGKGLARTGQGNGWARNTTGWNAVNNFAGVVPGATCYFNGWLRHSDNLTGGYMSVRALNPDGSPGAILSEIPVRGPNPSNPANAGYNYYTVPPFNALSNTRVLIYVGLWGNGQDSWIQADDLAVSCVY